jgi:hypothetical protein
MHVPNARLVCIDLAGGSTTQAPDQTGKVLNIGGFSDAYFDVIAEFANSGNVVGNPGGSKAPEPNGLFVQHILDSVED